ncbi:MAG: hypothetical protein ACKPKO_20170, partial [Candidatus Fonsibacter sp.]
VPFLTTAVPGPVAYLDPRFCMIDVNVDDEDDLGHDTMLDTKFRPPAGLDSFWEMYRNAITCTNPAMERERSIEGARDVCDILRNQLLSACVREAQPQFEQ